MVFLTRNKPMRLVALLLILSSAQKTLAEAFSHEFILQVGAFDVMEGKPQQVNINGLLGNYFTIDNHHSNNVLLGLGYYLEGFDAKQFGLWYGANAFYFPQTIVKGGILQEQQSGPNLSYKYSIERYPIYFSGKALIRNTDRFSTVFDAGIGPDIIRTINFSETSLDGITSPDNPSFSGATKVALSATVGAGIRINHVFGQLPLECDYRFFYLGQGKLNKDNNQYLNTLSTGHNYANALMFSLAF